VKKILIVFGTRPEAIKMAPLVKEFSKNPDFNTIVCVTGQHRQMLDQVLSLFEIVPDFDLDVMLPGQDLYELTSRILLGMHSVLNETKPDLTLVHGDTTTSATTALASFYMQIPVGHVEAGLRTNNKLSPWPEEMNRQLTSRIATLHFAPTDLAKANLLKENINEKNICVTGNTIIDALLSITERIKSDRVLENQLKVGLVQSGYDPERLQYKKLVLITGHRRENFGKGFLNICEAIKTLSEQYTDFDFVYPVHMNPNVNAAVFKALGKIKKENVFLLEPMSYLPFVYLMNRSYLILTDSGGIQEEAPSLGKPVLVMRDTTERTEALDAGTVELVGTDIRKIIDAVESLIKSADKYRSFSTAQNPYGDGFASARVVEFIEDNL
jgi:UDP-N-acetylglucosamine 2-epimerase (non-hydrolysing)